MQHLDSKQPPPMMGRDPNSNWVHWITHSRLRKIRIDSSTLETTPSSNSLPSSLFQSSSSSSNAGDYRFLPSRSIATDYFALLLSANEYGVGDGGFCANRDKQQGNHPRAAKRDLDSEWVAWFAERWHQRRQTADISEELVREEARGSEQPFRNINTTPSSPTVTPKKMKPQSDLSPSRPENAFLSDTDTDTDTATSAMSAVPSSEAGPINLRFPSPLMNLWNCIETDSLSTTEFLPDFESAGPTNTPADGAGATAMPNNEGDLTWLEELDAFPFCVSDELKRASPTRKRFHEEDSGDYTSGDQAGLGCGANKRQRVLYS